MISPGTNLRILVTGGAGFIGSHIVDAYVQAGHRVAVVDNLTTGRRDNVNSRAQFLCADIRDPSMDRVFQRGQFDVVNHQAAQIDLRRSVADPAHDAEVNIVGTLNLLECARRHGVRSVIVASTGGAIYGDQTIYPTPESEAAHPQSPYGVAKLAIEHYLYYYRSVHGLRSVVLRYANVYGPRQDPCGEAGVVAIFIKRLLAGDRPIINGDGGQTRDFVSVDDVVQANLLALEYLFNGPGEAGPLVVNIGTGEEVSVNSLSALLSHFLPTAPTPLYGPAKPGEQRRSAINPSYAKQIMGWEPRVGLEEGLRKTWNWFSVDSVDTRKPGMTAVPPH